MNKWTLILLLCIGNCANQMKATEVPGKQYNTVTYTRQCRFLKDAYIFIESTSNKETGEMVAFWGYLQDAILQKGTSQGMAEHMKEVYVEFIARACYKPLLESRRPGPKSNNAVCYQEEVSNDVDFFKQRIKYCDPRCGHDLKKRFTSSYYCIKQWHDYNQSFFEAVDRFFLESSTEVNAKKVWEALQEVLKYRKKIDKQNSLDDTQVFKNDTVKYGAVGDVVVCLGNPEEHEKKSRQKGKSDFSYCGYDGNVYKLSGKPRD
ncbi:MAG: hypothetical protein WBQ73_02330 [Candidatus Babeliales bacterium]